MLTAYPHSNVRRSVYAILLFFAVLGPATLVVLAIKNARAPWMLITSLFGGILGLFLLCIWCAVYVQDEPQRVRIALIWIAVLFMVMVLGMIFTRLS
jgi:uncharacterized membrane protein